MTTTAVRPEGLDDAARYRAVQSRDRRFDGVFYTGVTTTGIYCRPSCPAVTPRRRNVSFYGSAAAAQLAGFRACRRCLPDATPGSPEWDVRADAADRAMRLVADGVVDREGVAGLAHRLGYSVRQLNRIVTEHWGAGPLALARARRAQTARVLVETTAMTMTDIAFAAGFASVRQFNDTIREVYAASPSELRGRSTAGADGSVSVRVAVREPFAAEELLWYLRVHLVDGVETVTDEGEYQRSLRLPHGPGLVRLRLRDRPAGVVPAIFVLSDVRDLAPALERVRRLLDADCDPVAVDLALGEDPLLAPLVAQRPGLRVAGHPDGAELAARAVLGQQVSLAGARTLAARLVAAHGEEVALDPQAAPDVTHLFPSAEALAGVDPEEIAAPRSRGRALATLMTAIASGEVPLDRSLERAEVGRRLVALRGIGPWTAGYVALRTLGDPDVFLPTDAGVLRAGRVLDADVLTASARWAPWRSYAMNHLWAHVLTPTEGVPS